MFDLREEYYSKKLSSPDNDLIIRYLSELIIRLKYKRANLSGKDKTQETQRINSIEKALNTIKLHNEKITSAKEAMKLDNIGKGIATRIEEILRTGDLKELEELDKYITPETKIKQELCKITGIGEVKAEQLIKLGITGIDDLITKYKKGLIKVEKNVLTHHITVGLEYYYDLLERIPWNEVNKIAKFLQKKAQLIDNKLNITVCGSYRRKLATCGDIDVLLTHNDIKNDESAVESNYLLEFVEMLRRNGFLVGDLTKDGKTKYMGVCKYKSDIGRRIDIRFISLDSYPCALLYFTGSGLFNKIMRNKANEMGYTINEYGIYKLNKDGNPVAKGEQIIVHNEKEIFDIINCIYIEPEERNFI